jgi:hypothetical protein
MPEDIQAPTTAVAPPTSVSFLDPDSLVAGTIRNVAQLLAGALVTYGVAHGSDVPLWVGVISGALTLGWSTWNKFQTTKYIAAASALPPAAPRAEIAAKAAQPDIVAIVSALSEADRRALVALLSVPTTVP